MFFILSCCFAILRGIYAQNVYEDPCLRNPCQHGGSCQRMGIGSSYLCACREGHWGQHCEFKPGETPCQDNKCHSGATCRPDAKETLKYRCTCTKEHYGQFCNMTVTQTPKQRCELWCGERGNARLDKKKKCKCDCFDNLYEGKPNCTTILGCQSMPCQNGANCTSKKSDEYKCKCTTYYEGPNCTEPKWWKFEKFGLNPCENFCNRKGGRCLLIPSDYKATAWVKPIATCICNKGYKGIKCETQADPCMLTDAEDRCNEKIKMKDPEYFEICGNLTEEIEICYNGGICQITGGIWPNQTKACQCKDPWMGVDCTVQNPCKADSKICTKNSTCVAVSSEHGTKYGHLCICQPGYSADDCHALDPNVCNDNPCHFGGICVSCAQNTSKISPYCKTRDDLLRKFVCACPIRRTGPKCDQTAFACDVKKCKNGGTCMDMNETDYICVCHEGYTGFHCETITDMCIAREPCMNDGTCTSLEDKPYFQCKCKDGTHGIACQIEYYNFAGYYIGFRLNLAIWSFVAGGIATVVFAFLYWLFLFCYIRTKHKQS